MEYQDLTKDYSIRPIEPGDSESVRDIILETLMEHGLQGPGFASSDRDTQEMFGAFQALGRSYFVVERNGIVLGGAGIAPLPGEPGTCELVKMYFRPQIRGIGLGKKLLLKCLEEARRKGYTRIYLETVESMRAARGLYEHLGFKQIPERMGSTGHFSCHTFYLMELAQNEK